MRGYAMNIRETGKLVGIFAFLLFAVFRQRRVQLLFGSGLRDGLSNYAPWAVDLVLPSEVARVAVFCRVLRVEIGDLS